MRQSPVAWPTASRLVQRFAAATTHLAASSSLCRAVAESTNGSTPAVSVPEPVVKIDNESDPFATIVTIQYGDRLGELLDTVSGGMPARG